MGIICDTCGRDIDALGQDNMGVDAPLCEDCWGEQQSHAAAVLKRENASLSGEVRKLRFENARLREKLDAKAEKAAAHLNVEIGPALGVAALRLSIENVYETSRERALALTKLGTSAGCGWDAASPRRRRLPLRAARPRRRPRRA